MAPLVLDKLVGPITETINTQPKRNAVQQDEERLSELIRSAVKACRQLSVIPVASTAATY